MNKSFETKAKTDLDLEEKRSKLPDYFTEKKKKECSKVEVQPERMLEEKKTK